MYFDRRALCCVLAANALLGTPYKLLRSQEPPRGVDPPVISKAWVQSRGGTDNRGVIDGRYRVSWDYNATRPVRGISVADNLIVLGTESTDAHTLTPGRFKSDEQGLLIALEAASGQFRWIRTVPGWVHSDPAIYHGSIIATFGEWPMYESSGGVMAIDVRNGRTLWSRIVDGGIMPGPAIDSTAGSVLVVGEGVLYTLSLHDGSVLSEVGLLSQGGMSSPHIDDQRQVFLGTNKVVHSYSAVSNRLNWQYESPDLFGILDVPVALSDNTVFTAGWQPIGLLRVARLVPVAVTWSILLDRFRDVQAESTDEGSFSKWRHALINLFSSRGPFMEQWILAIDRRTGHLLWKRDLGVGSAVSRNTAGEPVLVGEKVVISSPVSRVVWVFDARSGMPLWHYQLTSRHKGAVTVVGNDVVFGDARGDLSVVQLNDGALIGRCRAGAPFTPTGPLVVGTTIIVATQDGWVHARPYQALRQRLDPTGKRSCFN